MNPALPKRPYLLRAMHEWILDSGHTPHVIIDAERPGVEVRHRKGYWALTPEETARAIAPPKPEVPKDVDNALGSLQTSKRNEYINSWVGLSRGALGPSSTLPIGPLRLVSSGRDARDAGRQFDGAAPRARRNDHVHDRVRQ